LKVWHHNKGIYDRASEFHFREWVCRRRCAWQDKRYAESAGLWILETLFGYGERWLRVIRAAALVLLAFVPFYFPTYTWDFSSSGIRECFNNLANAVYYSAISFTGAGIGSLISPSEYPLGALAAVEAFIGVFLMALFLVTFTRRWNR
jgi:hypothetical protein